MASREWSPDCTATLIRMVRGGYTDAEIAEHVGFCSKIVQRHRLALGFTTVRRNTWTAPLRRWRNVRTSYRVSPPEFVLHRRAVL